MKIGSLFSGIGGLELGLERSGLGHVVWQCEIDPFCRSVLERHWPNATRYEDVRSLRDVEAVDVICGGFPCQNLSRANVKTRTGLAGSSSGLWREFSRIVRNVRPTWIVVENVASAWRDWVPDVRLDLLCSGYSSVSINVSASDVGAPFDGARTFLVAKTNSNGKSTSAVDAQMAKLPKLAAAVRQDWGIPSPRALGIPDGVSNRVDRLRALGNAVVPQCAEVIGRAIVASIGAST